MKAKIYVTLKNGVLDPQGKAIEKSLSHLGFGGIKSVTQGKFIEIELTDTDLELATEKINQMCKTLLANTVIENYSFEIEPSDHKES